MIYFVISDNKTAKIFIKHFGLKKDMSQNKIEHYKGEFVRLIKSRKDCIGSAADTAYLLGINKFSSNDSIFHIGFCFFAKKKEYLLTICNKITNHETGKVFYPDILFRHNFVESSIESFLRKPADFSGLKSDMADFESAGFADSALTFLPPDRVFCLKAAFSPQDYLADNGRIDLSGHIMAGISGIEDLILEAATNIPGKNTIVSEKEADFLNRLCLKLKMTESLKIQLFDMAEKYLFRNPGHIDVLTPFFNFEPDSVQKRKKIFSELEKILLKVDP